VRVGLSATTTPGTRPGERKARLLLEVLRDRDPDVLRFAHDLSVPPTSNQAERDLRPAKVQQNISGRLTSEARTQDRYTIRGVLSTAAKHGLNTITVLGDALRGQPWIPELPAPT
jgi:transposase